MKTKLSFKTVLSVLMVCVLLLQVAPVFASGGNSISVSPRTQAVQPGDSFTVDISIDAEEASRGAEIKLGWDPALVEVLTVNEGTYYSNWASANGANTFMVSPTINNTDGTFDVNAAIALMGAAGDGPTGEGVLFEIELKAKAGAAGTSALSIAVSELVDTTTEAGLLTVTVQNGEVAVGTPGPITVDIRATGVGGDVFNVSDFTVPTGIVTVGTHELNRHTAMGALAYYCQENSINIDIQQGSWGLYIFQIGSNAADENSWMYYANGSSPFTGADQYGLGGGEELHFVNFNLGRYSLSLTLDKGEIEVGDDITAEVQYADGDGVVAPVENAKVYVSSATDDYGNPVTPGILVGSTGSSGGLTFTWNGEGAFYPYAEWDGENTVYQWPVTSFTCGVVGDPGGPEPDPGVEGDTKIDANIASSLILTPPADISAWPLTVGDNNETGTLNVKSNQPWQAQVADANTQNKGHMSKWANGGFDWTASLTDVMSVEQGDYTIDLSVGGAIASGTVDGQTGNEGENFGLVFNQKVYFADPVLSEGFYRIVLAFTGEAQI